MIIKSLGFVLVFCTTIAQAAELKTTSLNGSIGVTSWKALRDSRVVKQAFDYSCGAASVATLLNGFYGLDVTETDILESIGKDAAASFENLAHAVIRPKGPERAKVAKFWNICERLILR